MDLRDIQNLIRFVAKSGATEVKLEMDDVKITIKTTGEEPKGEAIYYQQPIVAPTVVSPPISAVPPMGQVPVAEAPSVTKTEDENSKYLVVKSPIIGTFYRRPAPSKPMFVEVGDAIVPGQALCVVEAMKLFNEIESEVSGRIVKVLVEDASPVEYDQPLFLVDPS